MGREWREGSKQDGRGIGRRWEGEEGGGKVREGRGRCIEGTWILWTYLG